MAEPVKGLAVVCRVEGDIVVEELTFMPPRAGEVRLKVHACGLCQSDVAVVKRKIPFPLPNLLGHEGAGVIDAVGPSVTQWKVGDRVILTLVMPCNRCPDCLGGQPSLCKERSKSSPKPGCVLDASGKNINLMSGLGCMGEYAVVSELACVRTTEDMPLAIGALVSCGVTTGVGAAINCAKVRPGSSCCIVGCGGVGLSAIQGARISGARQIIAVDMVPSKLEAAKMFGATHFINPSDVKDVTQEISKLSNGGVDYAFEAIGLAATVEHTINSVRSGGTAVIVGVPEMTATVPLKIASTMFMERVIKGSLMGSSVPSNFVPMLCDLYKKGDLLLDEMVSKHYSIQEAKLAFDDLAAGANLRGVIVMHDLKGLATGPTSHL